MSRLKIYTDGGSRGNPGPAGIGVYVVNERREPVFKQSLFIGRATNNEAEYKAFLASLEWLQGYLKTTAIDEVKWFLDSKLVVEQVNKNWKIKEDRLKEFVKLAWKLLSSLECKYQISHVRRVDNQEADGLVNQALDAI
ncbi:ribonuclease HI family protein [Patescibacteria group bacterium]|nr:ribonuclease HI family protein [Patescibacteria group bacterium]MBU1966674.1 ribonuclease HI family protein [Patescibacteria group bacterium]MBU2543354.1 ribonuclease HI family protein [Patescibacteria group bacterium]